MWGWQGWVLVVAVTFIAGMLLGAALTGWDTNASAGVDEKLADVEQAPVKLQEQRSAAPSSPTTTICNRSILMQENLLLHYFGTLQSLCAAVTSGELYRLEGLNLTEYNHRLRPNDFADMVNLFALRIYRGDPALLHNPRISMSFGASDDV